jgi:hypothetical protein
MGFLEWLGGTVLKIVGVLVGLYGLLMLMVSPFVSGGRTDTLGITAGFSIFVIFIGIAMFAGGTYLKMKEKRKREIIGDGEPKKPKKNKG